MKERGVQAIFTVGDNAYVQPAPPAGDTPAQWDVRFFRPYAPVLPSAALFPAPGDHEYLTPWAKGYTDAFELPGNERFYSFDWGDLHVAVLDSNCIVPIDAATAGCTTAELTAWLDADLAATRAPWKLALIHRPAVGAGHYGVYPQIPAALVPLFQKHGVDLVLQGHNHLYERTWPTRDGQPVQKDYDHPSAPVYVTTGGAGDWIYACDAARIAPVATCVSAYEHVVLTLDGGTLRIEAIHPDGSPLDAFEIVKDVPAPVADPPTGGAGGAGGAGGGGGGTQPPTTGTIAKAAGGCATGGGAGLAAIAALAGLGGVLLRRSRPPHPPRS